MEEDRERERASERHECVWVRERHLLTCLSPSGVLTVMDTADHTHTHLLLDMEHD